MTNLSKRSKAVRAALETDEQFGAVVPPLHLSSNFAFEAFDTPRTYDYTRSANPTRDALGEAIAELEGGAGGTVAASGMAAIHLTCQLLNPGDLVVAPSDCYGGTYRYLTRASARGLFDLVMVDQTDPEALSAALAKNPAMVWVETPTNPLLKVVDLAALSEQSHAVGARVVVDNTFLSPALQRPLEHGADIVVHSTTKFLNGHSDVVSGCVVCASADDHAFMQDWANVLGVGGSPFDSFLALRGIRTLHARMTQHEKNARAIAELLRDHPAVERVYYPGFEDDPGHEIASRQQDGFGGLVSFDLAGGKAAAEAFVNTVEMFTLAVSLGGVESLSCHPATMTHLPLSEEAKEAAGIGYGLVRLSAGIEDTDDLLADVRAGLEAAKT